MVNNPPATQGRPRFDPWVGKIPWRRKQLLTPVFLPGEFHGQRELAGYNSWGLQRVRHNWLTCTYPPFNQPKLVFSKDMMPPIKFGPNWQPEEKMGEQHCCFRSPNSGVIAGVQSLSHVRLFATPWTVACQSSLSITNSQSLPILMSIESVMPSNHLLLPSIFPSIRVFSNESALCIRWPKY